MLPEVSDFHLNSDLTYGNVVLLPMIEGPLMDHVILVRLGIDHDVDI